MGLIVPQIVKVRTNSSNYKHYKEKGYIFKKCGDFIEVDVLDLPKGSGTKVKIICDICGKEAEICYGDVIKCNKENELITCGSNSCKNKKYKNTCTKKYGKGITNVFQSEEVKEKSKQTWQKNYGEGIINPFQAESVKEKSKQTMLNNHGVENSMQNEEIRNKAKATCQEKYGGNSAMCSEEIQNKSKTTCLLHWGVDYPFQSEEVKEKIKATWKNNYGEDITSPFQLESIKEKSKQTLKKNYGEDIENPFQVESVKEKSKQTLLKNYGVENPMQCEEIKNKTVSSFQFNGTGPSSRAQRYINHILNGTLNKHICGSLADIYIEKENIIIEHDGSGHFLGDIMNGNKTPTKESLLYEKEREYKIINNGYRMIRFIATKDRIPSDEVILNLVEGFKNSDFKVIRINFEEGTIDRDYEEKWYCNFGELRKITKEDLKQFEK